MAKEMSERVASRAVYAMAGSYPKESGVPGVKLWFSPDNFDGKKLRHGPRLKVNDVQTDKLLAILTVEDDPRFVRGELPGKLLKQVKAFIKLNRRVIDDHWNNLTSPREALNAIRPIKISKKKA